MTPQYARDSSGAKKSRGDHPRGIAGRGRARRLRGLKQVSVTVGRGRRVRGVSGRTCRGGGRRRIARAAGRRGACVVRHGSPRGTIGPRRGGLVMRQTRPHHSSSWSPVLSSRDACSGGAPAHRKDKGGREGHERFWTCDSPHAQRSQQERRSLRSLRLQAAHRKDRGGREGRERFWTCDSPHARRCQQEERYAPILELHPSRAPGCTGV